VAIQFALRVPVSLARKGHDLAVQRNDYYRELYASGRWHRYGSEADVKAKLATAEAELAQWRTMLAQSGEQPEITLA
jgi:hypothetical protein